MKVFKNPIFMFLLGAIIFTGIGTYATIKLQASEIEYNNTPLDEVLDDLYESASGLSYIAETNPIPTSTADNRMIYSSDSGGETGLLGFDKNDNTFWTSKIDGPLPQYLGWDFEENVIVYGLSIKNRSDFIDKNVTSFTLQGYNSNNQWEDIQSYTCTNMEKGATNSFVVYNPKRYLKYRIYITGASSSGKYVQINQLDFYYFK